MLPSLLHLRNYPVRKQIIPILQVKKTSKQTKKTPQMLREVKHLAHSWKQAKVDSTQVCLAPRIRLLTSG